MTQANYGNRFLKKYCSDIFSDTPVVAYAPNPIYMDTSETFTNYIYCRPSMDAAKSLELILTLRPSIQQLYVIIGASENEQKARDELPRQLAPFSGRLAITYLSNLSLPELLERTYAIEEGQAAILFVDFVEDAKGAKPIPASVIRAIAKEARVPVFGSFSTHLGGGGGVGGYVLNMTALGGKVGEKALAILKGTATLGKIETLDISEYQFDWPELQRWGFDESKLPLGSKIMNKPPSFWVTYKWYIVSSISAGFLVMVLQFAVIALYRRKQQKQEADLLRLDRLNLVGEMAASIGHEVRNPLTTVRGYLQMFLRRQDYVQHRQQFTTMVEELDRANAIISEFLSLAKNKAVEMKPDNLNDIISALLPMLQSEAYRTDHDIEIDMADIPDILMDIKEIRQLLLNLARNAFEAMEAGGKLTIATCADAGYVLLTVRDTGKGIPKDVINKLGTPFLSTKENGTGLGLPVCYRIAERHGAKINVKTSPEGTTFSVYFKISQG
ncbi:MAG: ATP-binding protein [Negativicutes bacterium]|nr:ATP-binding protein [Negativicutes bacterium]